MSFKGEHKGTGHYTYDHEVNKLRLTMNETHNVNNTLNVDLLMLFEEVKPFGHRLNKVKRLNVHVCVEDDSVGCF